MHFYTNALRNIAFRFSVFIFAFSVLTPNSSAEEWNLNAKLCNDFFVVPVTLKSDDSSLSDEERTLHFLYDTGASHSVVDLDSIRRVSGKRIKIGTNAKFGKAQSGDLTYDGLKARGAQLDHLQSSFGNQMDGILAYDAFGDLLIRLDYANNHMSLMSGRLPRSDNKTIFSSRGSDKRPWIEIDVQGQRRKLLIDSGSSNGFSLRNLDSYTTLKPPIDLSLVARFDRFERRQGARLATNINIGDYIFEQPIVLNLQRTELLGQDVLKYFVSTFDIRKRRVRLEQNVLDDLPIRLEPVKRTGLLLKPHVKGRQIIEILPYGPAANTGLLPGDIITHSNGTPVGKAACREDREQPDEITLTILREDQKFDVNVNISKPLID